jgi:hypothetical protein
VFAERCGDALQSLRKFRDDEILSGIASHQRQRMDRALLSDPINAADALFQTRRIPGQLVIDYDPATAVKVQPFRRGIGCEKQAAVPIETPLGLCAFGSGHSSMKKYGLGKRRSQLQQGVSILGKDDDGVAAQTSKEPTDERQLGIRAGRVTGRIDQEGQPSALASAIVESGSGQRAERLVIVDGIVVGKETQLRWVMAATLEEIKTTLEGPQRGARRGQRALSKDGHRQTGCVGVVARLAPDLRCVLREQTLKPPLHATDSDRGESVTTTAQCADVVAGTPEHQRGHLAGKATDVSDGFEAAWIAGIRRGAYRDDAARPPRKKGDRCVTFRRRRGCVDLVDDDEIPDLAIESSQDIWSLEKVNRHEVDAGQRPRTDVARQVRERASEPARVSDDRVEAEARGQFGTPLLAQTSRHGHDRPRVPMTGRDIRDDPSGLNGLSEADFVRKDQARLAAGRCERRGELIGKK